jgi:hypothetical protein
MRAVSTTVEQLADLATSSASTAHASLKDLGTQIARIANQLAGRHESNRLRSVLWFAGTLTLAGGVVLVFASPGRELRKRIAGLFSSPEESIGTGDRAGEEDMASEGRHPKPRHEARHLEGAP